MTLPSPDRMLRPSEVATLLNVSERSLARFITAGAFPHPIRVGRQRRFSLAAIEAWLAKNGGAK